uniref:Uncharacterized protein n=1 Tax=Paramoeba aestuarina TaxID=180227 RepID=A0A7S4L1K0_9EUKA|mmetsp:Transcript_29391/g.45433  ORF Transcript_29391/g.45433 Transcript_29391/m.45433 type:complete len:274 (+) Transcript_29391:30-851(+)
MKQDVDHVMGEDLKRALEALRSHVDGKRKGTHPTYDPSKDRFELFLMYNTPPESDYGSTAVRLPYPYRNLTKNVCIFVPDEQGTDVQNLITSSLSLKEFNLKVLEVNTFRREYSSLKLKKQLRDDYSLFLIDTRVIRPKLLALLGKMFLSRHFDLFTVDASTAENLEQGIKTALQSISINFKGTSMQTIDIGSMKQSADELYANARDTLQNGVLSRCAWKDIDSIMVSDGRHKARLFVYAHDFSGEMKSLPEAREDEVSVKATKRRKGSSPVN